MRKALIISFSPIRSDPRVMRQIQALKGDYLLTVAGFGEQPSPDFVFHDIGAAPASMIGKARKAMLLLLRMYETYYWGMSYVKNALYAVQNTRFDVVIANDISSLPVALKLAQGAPVLIDAHEYSPREFEDLFLWRLFFAGFYTALCNKYLPKAASMTTVCRGIANEYEQFGVKPKVVFNCPPQQELPVQPVDPGRIKLIHHGVPIRSRKLELMIDMMRFLDGRYTLDLMLVDSNPAYMAELKEMAAEDSRIRFINPVPMQEIATTINAFDIGVFLLPPVNFNYKHALPNKFFEFVQARLAVAIGPSPEMASLVRQYGFGVVADSFEAAALATLIRRLNVEEIKRMKCQADLASRELNATRASSDLSDEVARLLG